MHKLVVLSFILIISLKIANIHGKREILRYLQDNSQPDSKSTENKEDPSKNNEGQKNESKVDQKADNEKDELIVPRYKSALTEEQRKEYMTWVEFKNSLNSYEGQLAKLTKYFSPENPTYYSTIYKFGWPFYSLAGVFGFILLIYIILRFGFRYCLGPKHHITSYYAFFTWTLISSLNL